jgi:hypothetical protein
MQNPQPGIDERDTVDYFTLDVDERCLRRYFQRHRKELRKRGAESRRDYEDRLMRLIARALEETEAATWSGHCEWRVHHPLHHHPPRRPGKRVICGYCIPVPTWRGMRRGDVPLDKGLSRLGTWQAGALAKEGSAAFLAYLTLAMLLHCRPEAIRKRLYRFRRSRTYQPFKAVASRAR